jgi:hypothetical protein
MYETKRNETKRRMLSIISALAGATASGAAVGIPIFPNSLSPDDRAACTHRGPLAIGAGVVSGLVVAVTGSAVTVVGCHIAAANSKNQCNHDLNTELDVIRNNHKSCVQQCKAAARNGGN